jgi:hypothetical protein
MLSEAGITFFGFTITTMQLWLAGSALLCVALFVALARGKRIAMQRSVVTDEIAGCPIDKREGDVKRHFFIAMP